MAEELLGLGFSGRQALRVRVFGSQPILFFIFCFIVIRGNNFTPLTYELHTTWTNMLVLKNSIILSND